MRRGFSKTFVMCVAVLAMGFYLGATSFASEESIITMSFDEKQEDTLYESLCVAVANSYVIESEDLTNQILAEPGSYATSVQETSAVDELKNANFDNIGIAVTESSINVRKSAGTTSDVVGKLYNGAFVTIKATEGDWYQIVSGKVKGYVKADLLITGDDAATIYDDYLEKKATVNVETLNVRKEKSSDSAAVAQIKKENKYTVLEQEKDWVKIRVKDKIEGYVAAEYVNVEIDYAVAISIEDEKALLVAEAASTLLASASNNYEITNNGIITTMTDEEFKLFVCLIFAESGAEPYDGKLGVANVIVNRIHSSKFPDTLEEVVYQSGQFGPTWNGALNKQLAVYEAGGYTKKAHKDAINAAKAALQGYTIVGTRCYFNGYKAEYNKGHQGTLKIGNHLFWEIF